MARDPSGPYLRRRVWAEPVRERWVERRAVEPTGNRAILREEVTGSLPVIAARDSRSSLANPVTEIEGVIPRALTSRAPAQMINPLAPLDYGSAWSFVTFTERDPYRTDNLNKNHLQTNGIRFLTLRPLW
jgi:hypothetical protein